VGEDAQRSQRQGEAVNEANNELQNHDAVDQPDEDTLGDDGVFLDDFGEVVQTRCLSI
jgi:hypothetical protein